MFNLFNKGPKVRAGKQSQDKENPSASLSSVVGGKKPANKFGGLGGAWKKLNSMDRKQAYTWGAVAVVALVALLTLGTAMGSSSEEDFSGFETRGYDLANMPFSTDEAEQFLLASKYPDLKDKTAAGLYTKADKEARQAEDAEKAAELDASSSSNASAYVPGRYYGGGSSGSGSPTAVGSLSSANLKGASGSGISGTFGPSGDFSNFRSQEKGGDKFTPQGPGSGNARKALFQSAMGSRAAAGQKNDKLLNAKKAMMGGNVKGSGAFLNDSGAVSLKDAKGLELDTNAPVSSADLGGMDDALNDAKEDAEEEAKDQDEREWWQDLLIDVAKMAAQQVLSFGMNSAQDAIAAGKAARLAEGAVVQEFAANSAAQASALSSDISNAEAILGSGSTGSKTINNADGSTTQVTYTKNNDTNEIVETRSTMRNGTTIGEPTTRNLTSELRTAASQMPVPRRPTDAQIAEYARLHKQGALPENIKSEITFNSDGSVEWRERGQVVGKIKEDGTFERNKGANIRLHKNNINEEVFENVRQSNLEAVKKAGADARITANNKAYSERKINGRGSGSANISVGGLNYNGDLSSDGKTFTTTDGKRFTRSSRSSDDWK